MLTKNEISTLNLSPTKKDFVQIWNELLEVAGKLSERWDPTSTNESDPGIVILKALAGIADKLNYNIDKNTLEAFMPTAAQEDSMRKLCEMLGYNIKYYRSAETTATIRYLNPDPDTDDPDAVKNGLRLPKFTALTNSDQDINYFTTNQTDLYLFADSPVITVSCMEGQLVKCESTSNNNVITVSQISENNRYYLPEAQIAENGIFVYNTAVDQFSSTQALTDGAPWEKVENLNIQPHGSRVFKFGYDSYEGRPYIELPDDYSELINDGLFIYYARTSGANGNISAGTLTQIELPSSWSEVSADSFSVENPFSATSGANIETIGQAYNNFKKTIGTFETLVTCRDYMNYIYGMTKEDTGKAVVSNILVTDIRTDLNNAVTICSCDNAGIFYKDVPLTKTTTKTVNVEYNGEQVEAKYTNEEQLINHFDLVLYPFKSYTQIKGNVRNIQSVYNSSFKYDHEGAASIKDILDLSSVKTIAHNIKSPNIGDIISINNYLRLNAVIGTHSKVTTEEGTLLIDKIKIAIANAFNMRELDFGEEIPFDSLMQVIVEADPRISVVSLTEPALYTTFSVFDGIDSFENPILREYAVASEWLTEAQADASGNFDYPDSSSVTNTFDTQKAKEIYNYLAVRNILAGRVPLFKYNNTFSHGFTDGAYRITEILAAAPSELMAEYNIAEVNAANPFVMWIDNAGSTYTGQWVLPTDEAKKETNIDYGTCKAVYTKTYTPDMYKTGVVTAGDADDSNYIELSAECTVKSNDQVVSDVTLADGETIKFRAPNFITLKTYPAYVNYRLDLGTNNRTEGEYATAYTLQDLLNTTAGYEEVSIDDRRQEVLDYFSNLGLKKTFILRQKVTASDNSLLLDGAVEIAAIENPQVSTETENYNDILHNSGFIKLVNENATVLWADSTDSGPNVTIPLELKGSKFIVNSEVLSAIKTTVDNYISSAEGLPTDKDWTVSYTFEYVPFEHATLNAWARFVADRGSSIFGFEPITEHGATLWRAYNGEYTAGKYILQEDSAKLMPFASSFIGTIDDGINSRLNVVYVVKDIGKDVQASFISNNEEYMLKAGEYLYIEYTPSVTTEDESTTEVEPVTTVYGSGTIIRPSGFEVGLVDSTAYELAGNSAHKTVKFEVSPTSYREISLHSLGASEQIEIRDFAQVILNKSTLPNASEIYIYKNFNNCDDLETDRGSHCYTLKDGEYIFYTDQHKAEFAYFTSGTEVTIPKKTVLPKFEIIDLATIFDSGIREIPWKPLNLVNNEGITFQEYQYVTLGGGDTLKNLLLSDGTQKENLTTTWKKCDDVTYILAGTDSITTLPKINIKDQTTIGNGWEVCSLFELSASPSLTQTLRSNAKIETSITLYTSSTSNVKALTVEPVAVITDNNMTEYSNTEHSLSFKTNLLCSGGNNTVKLSELYTNSENLKSFELKVFENTAPTIVKTIKGKLIPYHDDNVFVDMTKWPSANKTITTKSFGELWTHVTLDALCPEAHEQSKLDYALKLPISILPNTYGIFSIYNTYNNTSYLQEAEDPETYSAYIVVPDGITDADISIFNGPNTLKITTATVKDANGNDVEINKLQLMPGINCIRVNKTMDIFIKHNATKSSKHAIYFDNLRLVDCKPLKYVDANGNNAERLTQGLNLAQIGYLDTNTDNLNIFDARIRKKAKKDLVSKAIANLDTLNKQAQYDYEKTKNELTSDNNIKKLREFAAFISAAKAETSLLLGKDTVDSLFANYYSIVNELKCEKQLRDQLETAINIDEVEQQLAILLEGFTNSAALKQPLIKELDTLRQTILASLDNVVNSLQDVTVIADFYDSAVGTEDGLISSLKVASIKEINRMYSARLTALEEAIREITDPATKNTLYSVLTEVSSLYTSINNLYSNMTDGSEDKEDTAAILDTINELLVTYAEDIVNLTETEQDAVIEILTQLEEHTNARATAIASVSTLTSASFAAAKATAGASFDAETILPYAKYAIRAVWPNYIRQQSIDKLDTLYNAVINAISNAKEPSGGALTGTSTLSTIAPRQLIKDLIYFSEFVVIFDKAKNINSQTAQNSLRKSFVEAILSARQASSEVSNTVTTLATNVANRHVILKNIAASISNTSSITEKHMLIKDLRAELDAVIAMDTELEEISAKLLYPHILAADSLLFDKKSDAFYNRLINWASTKKAAIHALLANSSSVRTLLTGISSDLNTAVSVTDTVLAVISDSTVTPETLNTLPWVTLANIENSNLLLSKQYLELLNNCKYSIDTMTDVDSARDSYLIKLLNKDFVIAWQDTNGNWLDDAGNYYQKYIGANWAPYPAGGTKEAQSKWIDAEGSWQTASGKHRTNDGRYVSVDLMCSCAPGTDGEPAVQTWSGSVDDITVSAVISAITFLITSSSEQLTAKAIYDSLYDAVSELSNFTGLADIYREAYSLAVLEDNLISEIKALDKNNDFYWNVPVEANVAIDFNESDESHNTLMNPAINYDVNNINNNFVISKVDINYLTSGLQIARSSRIG